MKMLRATILISTCALVTAGCSESDILLIEDSNQSEVDFNATDPFENYSFESDPMNDEERESIEANLANANTADDDYYMMVRAIGGEDRYEELLEREAEDTLVQIHRHYNFDYEDRSVSNDPSMQSRDITDCIHLFPGRDRNKSIKMNDNTVKIDKVGRPFQSTVVKEPFKALFIHPTNSGCQGKVAEWGKTGDQGGHLVGKSIGGYNKRANLVPQNSNFNQGVWNNLVEKSVKKCFAALDVVIRVKAPLDAYKSQFKVKALYSTNKATDLRPYGLFAELKGIGKIPFYPAWPKKHRLTTTNVSTKKDDSNLHIGRVFKAFVDKHC